MYGLTEQQKQYKEVNKHEEMHPVELTAEIKELKSNIKALQDSIFYLTDMYRELAKKVLD